MATKKDKKETKVRVKVRDLKPRKDAKGGGHFLGTGGNTGLGSNTGLGAHGSH
jgi:hypothetical protein